MILTVLVMNTMRLMCKMMGTTTAIMMTIVKMMMMNRMLELELVQDFLLRFLFGSIDLKFCVRFHEIR